MTLQLTLSEITGDIGNSHDGLFFRVVEDLSMSSALQTLRKNATRSEIRDNCSLSEH